MLSSILISGISTRLKVQPSREQLFLSWTRVDWIGSELDSV